MYDFIDKAPDRGRVTPYGVYELTLSGVEGAANEVWVSVGTNHDTARFAAQTILACWTNKGRPRYPRRDGAAGDGPREPHPEPRRRAAGHEQVEQEP